MENLSRNTSPTLKKKNLKRKSKFTSSERESKTPKHLLTTSEEDRPKIRSIKTMTSISKEKETLRALLQQIKTNRSNPGNGVHNDVDKNSNDEKAQNQNLEETTPTTPFSTVKDLSHEQL